MSIAYNKFIKKIKVHDLGFYKPEDIAYHLLRGQMLNQVLVEELLKLNEDSFLENLENANNILDLNNEGN